MKNCIILSLFFFTILSGCIDNGPVGFQTDEERQATLNSLKKINNYPLYTMTYYGDYGLKNYLNNQTNLFLPVTAKINDGYMCTCFTAQGTDSCTLFGRNFDWHAKIALMLFANPPDGYASMSMVHLTGLGYSCSYPLEDKHNQDALLSSPFWPVDGINECGVAIGGMAVDHVEPPYNPNKKTLNRMIIMRLVLDYAKDLDEAIQLLNKYNFVFPNDPLHFIICDAAGNSAVVEFLENELKVVRSKDNFQVSTNTILYNNKMPETADFHPYNADTWSKWRYAKVYEELKSREGIITKDEALNTLKSAAVNITMWSAVYNTKTCEMDIVTNRNFSEIHHFSLR